MKTSDLRLPGMAASAALLLCVHAHSATAQDSRKSASLPPARTSTAIDVPKLKYTDFTLPNGLRVILHEDHSSPVVTVEMMYHVGSKNDVPGKSGLAHMFEHMLDEGTLNLPGDEFKRTVLQGGGIYEAHTQTDWTQYFTTIRSNYLETALWLEAERMTNLSPALDSTRFERERDAVRNEYKLQILGSPEMSSGEAMFESLYAGSAYRLPLIGYQSELGSATVSDLRAFYEKYYVPNNTVLVVVGDFATPEARRMVEKHFSAIPRGKPVVQPTDVKPLKGETRIVVEHPQTARQLWFAWRGASSASPDRATALALSSILGDRLRRVLVTERRLATSVNRALSTNWDLEASGVLQLAITVAGTAPSTATEVERVTDSVVASIRTNGVTAQEVRRWVASYRQSSLTGMQTSADKALLFADGVTTQKNPAGNLLLVDRALSMTPAQVNAAAVKYLTGDRVVLNLVPSGKLDLISKPELPYTNASRKGQ